MLNTLHKIAAILATASITIFWLSTIISELFLSHAAITTVKTCILYGLFILIPSMAVAGGTGFKLAKGRRGGVLGAKAKRMPIIAANGILILVPAAFFLASKASGNDFDTLFYSVQGIELLAGATNLTLLAANIRDGRRMTAGKRAKAAKNKRTK